MSYGRQATFDNPYAAELQSLRSRWGWFLVLGIILVIVGIAALGRPLLTALVTETVFAVLMLIAAGVEFASAIWAGAWRGFFAHLLAGVLFLIVGEWMLEHPGVGVAGLALIMAVSFMVKGALSIIVALTQRFHAWGWILFSGVISLLLGLFILANWPWVAADILTIYIGIEILFMGWTWIMLALAARSIPQAPAV